MAIYGDGSNSTVGTQYNLFKYDKKAIIEQTKAAYFGQLGGTMNQPKHFGKTVKKYRYIPILDDRNINDQGLDTTGRVISTTNYTVTFPALTGLFVTTTGEAEATALSVVNDNIHNAGSAVTIAVDGGTDIIDITGASNTDLVILYATEAKADAVVAEIPGSYKQQQSGNLYASSKDPGTIGAKLPILGEEGGRVNRVGWTRLNVQGTIEKFGFFADYTEESLAFDTDAQLKSHMYRELGRASGEITEDKLMIDLASNAGIVRYAGTSVTSLAGIDGNSGLSAVTYSALRQIDKELTANRCPFDTQIITGSRLIDTKTVSKARYAYISDAVRIELEDITDTFSNQAWVPVRQYGAAGTIARGEVGAVNSTRFIEVPEMLVEEGVGVAEGTNALGFACTNGRFDAHPILFVGSGSFTQIGFNTDGRSSKFVIYSKSPGSESADRNDPYGETGFYSIKWYYGLLVERPEWIAKYYIVAK